MNVLYVVHNKSGFDLVPGSGVHAIGMIVGFYAEIFYGVAPSIGEWVHVVWVAMTFLEHVRIGVIVINDWIQL